MVLGFLKRGMLFSVLESGFVVGKEGDVFESNGHGMKELGEKWMSESGGGEAEILMRESWGLEVWRWGLRLLSFYSEFVWCLEQLRIGLTMSHHSKARAEVYKQNQNENMDENIGDGTLILRNYQKKF